eukprot:Skav226564  [mRNA]  locus=scaffold1701:61962:65063:- [translate_table: standard]
MEIGLVGHFRSPNKLSCDRRTWLKLEKRCALGVLKAIADGTRRCSQGGREEMKFRKVYEILEALAAKQVTLERDVANLLYAAGGAFPSGYAMVTVPYRSSDGTQ